MYTQRTQGFGAFAKVSDWTISTNLLLSFKKFSLSNFEKKINYQVAAKLAAKAVLNINSNINKLWKGIFISKNHVN